MPPSTTSRLAFVFGTFIVIVFGIYYQVILQKVLLHGGYWRSRIEGINNEHCHQIPGLEACEKLIRLSGSGLVYLACSNPTKRTFWEPATGRLNATGRSLTDYIAIYDPSTSHVKRLTLTRFPSLEPLALQSFDVVPSDTNSSELFLFLINHRPPTDAPALEKGADSVVEIFVTHEGSVEMEHIKTIRDPSVIITPNDIVGNGDGSFYFTNNARSKTGIMRKVDTLFRLRSKSIGYCTYEGECKIAATGLPGANGIIRGYDGTFYVTNNEFGGITLLEQLEDNNLNVIDSIPTEMPMDKLSSSQNGHIYVAAFPKRLQAVFETLKDPSLSSASAVFRITKNTALDQFYGKKFKLDMVFQDDGKIASLSTSATYDLERGLLYISGPRSPALSICKIRNV